MKNDFIKIVMSDRNEFKATANLSFKGTDYTKVDVKIDTGCGYSSFPVSRLGINEKKAYLMKEEDAKNDAIKKSISFGVNDSRVKREEDRRKYRNKLYMELTSITFGHPIENLVLDGYKIGNCTIRVSYDRTGNILIGMDILKSLDIHIGTIDTGETVLLACRKGELTDEYREELNRLFDVRKIA